MKAKQNGVVLEAINISKGFPGVQALSNVDLSLRGSEVHALVGENGAGKSTLLNIIFGLIQPDTGKLLRNGEEVTIESPTLAQKYGIGIVPQELNLVPTLSVAENILLGMEPCYGKRLSILNWKEVEEKARIALERIGQSMDLEQLVGELSAAQQQLVQIARALVTGADILIFDEPTASLTFQESQVLFEIINGFRASGGSVAYVSHRMEEIMTISDRVTVLRDGKKVVELDTANTTVEEIVKHMVGREVQGTNYPKQMRKEAPVCLEVKDLTREDEFYDINFKLHEAEILGIAGLVGAGRTELARCIFGDTRPDRGEVSVFGKAVNHRLPLDGIRNGIAYLPEERRKLGIFSILGVGENITMSVLHNYKRRGGIDKKKEASDVNELINSLNIKTPSFRQKIGFLSGGNQQKAILARWLLTGSDILILDEPTRGIDINAKAEIHNLLRELVKNGKSVIVISSELQEVIDVADRILVMHEGKLKGELDAQGATQEQIMTIALR